MSFGTIVNRILKDVTKHSSKIQLMFLMSLVVAFSPTDYVASVRFGCGQDVCQHPHQFCEESLHEEPICRYCSEDICRLSQPPQQCEAACGRKDTKLVVGNTTEGPVGGADVGNNTVVERIWMTIVILPSMTVVAILFCLYYKKTNRRARKTEQCFGEEKLIGVNPEDTDIGQAFGTPYQGRIFRETSL
ncbi:hypothetical protein ScPMuIL_003812 [Solemya velum]